MKPGHLGAPARARWPIVAVFVAIVALQLAVAAFSIEVLSGVRAYINGESLYSKAQKDAHIHLLAYLEDRRDEDYRAFERMLAVPLGDRAAREALQRPQPDIDAARRAFVAGGNHGGDLDRMVRMFVWFDDLPFMAAAIATWTEADDLVQRLQVLGRLAQRQIAAGAGPAALAPIGQQVRALNERLSVLEVRFSAQLGDASRETQALLIALNAALAVLLCATGLAFVRRSAREQARTEDTLRHREASLQRLLDSAAEGLYGVDVQGRCTFINRAALQMLGYAEERELLGCDSRTIHDSRTAQAAAGDDEVCAAFRDNRRVHLPHTTLWRRDGSSFPAECWSHPVVEGGVTRGAVVTFVDISQRVKMAAALRANELRVMQLVDAVSEGVVTVDADERVVFFNRAAEAIFGLRAIDARRSHVARFVAMPDGQPLRLQGLGSGVIELIGIRSDARVFPIEASLARLDTGSGALTTIVLRDVTEAHAIREERRAREAHEAASRAKTEFLSRMSHELRTPLNAVLGFTHLLRLDKQQPPTLRQLERIEHIENAGAHLLALVNDVLDLSRVESGQMAVALEPVDLGPVVLESFGMVTALAAEQSVQLLVDGDGAGVRAPAESAYEGRCGPWVVGDPVRLRQVIVNLLSNAVKYNRPGGQVTLSHRIDDDACVVRITDTGRGIAAEQLSRLFEPFNRLGAERSDIEGSGIGLVLSRRLAELMGGTLAIESELGYGTTATLGLRLSRRAGASPPAEATPRGHAVADGPIDVLYVEDDPVNAELVRQVLQMRPAVTLRVAESGAAAIAAARRQRPDLMLIDMNLGDMNGVQLARRLQGDAATRGIPLVALSADALPEQIASAMASGFERYLTKPVDFHELLRLVDRSVGAGGCYA
ncbi:MAG TPA: ATP-binding protein [Burkholderiaceae bacterium]|nr:ATP-binding protein [Burkholderiaceae bacterium]